MRFPGRVPGDAAGGGSAAEAPPLPRDATDEPSGGMAKPAVLVPTKSPFLYEKHACVEWPVGPWKKQQEGLITADGTRMP